MKFWGLFKIETLVINSLKRESTCFPKFAFSLQESFPVFTLWYLADSWRLNLFGSAYFWWFQAQGYMILQGAEPSFQQKPFRCCDRASALWNSVPLIAFSMYSLFRFGYEEAREERQVAVET